MLYTIEAYGSGNFAALDASSYRLARRKASSLRNGYHSKVQIIRGSDIEYDIGGFPVSITDVWRCDGRGKWYRVNP